MVYLCDFELQSNLDSSNFKARTNIQIINFWLKLIKILHAETLYKN